FQPRHGLAFGVTSDSGSCQVLGSCFKEWGVSGSREFQGVGSCFKKLLASQEGTPRSMKA
ncbi:hypothetical protein Tco_0636590, partial [Tanacetum coccineum]